MTNSAFVDNNADGYLDGQWEWANDGTLHYFVDANTPDKVIGGGWNIYDTELSPGNLGGAQGYDVIARDSAGVLWLYLGYGDGTVTSRIKVGGGWEVYTQLAGKGDLDGDGKADIVARDTAGVLWFYKGTGNYNAPFAPRTRIGAGWNMFNRIVSTGDVDLDGRTDLLARDINGGLWLYKGTRPGGGPVRAARADRLRLQHLPPDDVLTPEQLLQVASRGLHRVQLAPFIKRLTCEDIVQRFTCGAVRLLGLPHHISDAIHRRSSSWPYSRAVRVARRFPVSAWRR